MQALKKKPIGCIHDEYHLIDFLLSGSSKLSCVIVLLSSYEMFMRGHDIGQVRPCIVPWERPRLGMRWWRPPKRPPDILNGEGRSGKRARRAERVLSYETCREVPYLKNLNRQVFEHLRKVIATVTLVSPFQIGDKVVNFWSSEKGTVTGYMHGRWSAYNTYVWFLKDGFDKCDRNGHKYRQVWCQSKVLKRKACDMEDQWWEMSVDYVRGSA